MMIYSFKRMPTRNLSKSLSTKGDFPQKHTNPTKNMVPRDTTLYQKGTRNFEAARFNRESRKTKPISGYEKERELYQISSITLTSEQTGRTQKWFHLIL